MNAEEYAAMAKVERDHWFYRGKRKFVQTWIRKLIPDTRGKTLLDCGCGTGIFAAEMQDLFQVIAMDDHEEALSLAQKNLGKGICKRGSALSIPADADSVDVITLLDVLEHIPDDRKALSEIHRVLKPKGWLLLTVPAFPMLWSDWDTVLHHCRRYRIADLLTNMKSAGFRIEHWNHTNVLLFPLIFLIRKWQTWFPKAAGAHRAEDRIPPAPVNRILEWQFVRLACQTSLRFPIGVSLLVVAQKKLDGVGGRGYGGQPPAEVGGRRQT